MTGLLLHAPTEPELERLYYELAQVGASAVGRKRPWPYRPKAREELIALSAEMLRYDARLLSILLQHLTKTWRRLHPFALRERMHGMRWPQALLVVLEFAKSALPDPELRYFADYMAAGFARVEPAERFFFDAERPASRIANRSLGRNLTPYARWGFIGTEKPTIDPNTKRTVGRYDAGTRRQILTQLAERTPEFSLAEYLDAVDHAISRQQALLDLQRLPGLRASGHGRGAKWHLRRPRRPAPDSKR